MKSVVIYSSLTGNARAVAEYIAEKTNGDAINIKKKPSVDGYDIVIFGSMVHAGRISGKIRRFIAKNNGSLSKKNVSLFVTCDESNNEKAQKQLDRITNNIDLRFKNTAYFVKGKELVKTGKCIDDFIKSLN